MSILTVNNLTKNYGRIQALKNVSFSVPEGVVFGILGPNGSGKTTLLGTVTDIIKPTSGSFTLFDNPASGDSRRKFGTLLETPNFYHYLNAVENLEITAAVKRKGRKDIMRVLELVNLHRRRTSKFSTFSLGMKQRLAIAACLLGDPQVLIFDEPTNGLDPTGIAEIRQLMRDLHSEGKTIIMASHLLDEVEKVCTHVAILKSGVLITSGEVSEILSNEEIIEAGASDLDNLYQLLLSFPDVVRIERAKSFLQLYFNAGRANASAINDYCHSKGISLNHLSAKRKSLESRFIELTNNN